MLGSLLHGVVWGFEVGFDYRSLLGVVDLLSVLFELRLIPVDVRFKLRKSVLEVF